MTGKRPLPCQHCLAAQAGDHYPRVHVLLYEDLGNEDAMVPEDFLINSHDRMPFQCVLQQVCELHGTWGRPKMITAVTKIVAVYGAHSWVVSDDPSTHPLPAPALRIVLCLCRPLSLLPKTSTGFAKRPFFLRTSCSTGLTLVWPPSDVHHDRERRLALLRLNMEKTDAALNRHLEVIRLLDKDKNDSEFLLLTVCPTGGATIPPCQQECQGT
ncbi:hypothetical protein ATEIFO6365_0009019600 [Aspergillus terreus]|uniref:Uncharacterized protein n=1 Tax=Aspergillus terreus TaxID=33178 RepID=A0A5M3Z7K6_ASPTE|nr:hypothetical protein ATETN484_0011019600 [Aspergillus terreus]GFF18833.1 hypothetical protein ATEIFO6365_0009019600 [Aspergillus terreus]